MPGACSTCSACTFFGLTALNHFAMLMMVFLGLSEVLVQFNISM
jgi:hypothetical protein